MIHTARCPACGAPVTFQSIASVLAVCEFCRSTLVREGEQLRNLGRMAELLPDQSPVRRGAEGRWQGRHFVVVGRVQLRHSAGLWNEWHLLLDDGSSAWLSESGDECVFTLPREADAALPAFAGIQVGQPLRILGHGYRVSNVLEASCVAGEGELPFVVGEGYAAPVVDLRDDGPGFATLDYSDDPLRPRLFVGGAVEFQSLDWSGLREPDPQPGIDLSARQVDCPACGAPLSPTLADVKTIACPACGALLDSQDARLQVISEARLRLSAVPRLLELGSRGRLRGRQVQVVGFLRRQVKDGGSLGAWSEYLLVDEQRKLSWLTEYRGHWNLGRVVAGSLEERLGNVYHAGQHFSLVESCVATVVFVLGEFPWQVRLDDTVEVSDYVAIPRLLSRERDASEETWTLSEYVDPQEVATAFQLARALPEPRGVQPNQPNPHLALRNRIAGMYLNFLLLALLIQIAMLLLRPDHALLVERMRFEPGRSDTQLSSSFELSHPVARLEVQQRADLDNNWIELELHLVNQDSSAAWHSRHELGEYHGVEGGESWQEDGRRHAVVFSSLPAGRYALAVDHDMDAAAPPVDAEFRVLPPRPRWSNLLLLAFALGLVPLFVQWRTSAFEADRRGDAAGGWFDLLRRHD